MSESKVVNKPKAGPKSKPAVEEKSTKKGAKKSTKKGAPKLPHGKKYRQVKELIVKGQAYELSEAVELVKKTATTKFVSAVELHAHLKQEARSSLQLPHSTGKTVKVAIATDEVIEQIAAGKIDFDILISEPKQMPKLAKFARALGPKGLMPNPKSGTVTEDVEKVKAELEAGKTEFRTDAGKNVHLLVGKVNSDTAEVVANTEASLKALSAFGLKSAHLTSTMGPAVKLVLPEA